MAANPIDPSLVNIQVSFKKVRRIYDNMKHSYPVYEYPLWTNDSSYKVRVKHYNVDKGSELTYMMDNDVNELFITGIIVCGTCAGDEGSVISTDHCDILKYPCGICHERKTTEVLKYKAIVKNTGEEYVRKLSFKLSFEMKKFWHFPGSLHQVLAFSRDVLRSGDSCVGIGDFPTCNLDKFLSDEHSLTIICELVTSDYDAEESVASSDSDSNEYPGILDLLSTLFSDANIDPEDANSDLGDIVLSIEGHKIHCHKLILSTCSNVFKAMFTTEMREKHNNEIALKGIQLSTVKSLLAFMYSDTVDGDEITTDLLAAAEFYEVLKLKRKCEKRLITELDTCNVARLWLCGYFHNAEELECTSIAFMARNWDLLIKDEEVQTLCKEYPCLAVMITKLLSSTDETGYSTDSST